MGRKKHKKKKAVTKSQLYFSHELTCWNFIVAYAQTPLKKTV